MTKELLFGDLLVASPLASAPDEDPKNDPIPPDTLAGGNDEEQSLGEDPKNDPIPPDK
jgi:hypothetical protein